MFGPGNNTDAFTCGALPASCACRHSVIVTTAAFVIAYTGVDGSGERPPLPEDVLMTCAGSPRAPIPGPNALMPWMTPHTFTAVAQPQSVRPYSHIAPSAPEPTPALLHSTCTAPNALMARSCSACTDAKSVTSVSTPSTSAPVDRIASTASSSTGASTSASTTRMPS